jgi:hypothetical protein
MKETTANTSPPPSSSSTLHSPLITNHLRKQSVVCSTADLRKHSAYASIPGETKRLTPRISDGTGKKNLLNLIAKQIDVQQKEHILSDKVKKQMMKESDLKKEKQDRIAEVFLKKESLQQKLDRGVETKPVSRQNTPALSQSNSKPADRGNLNFFLDSTNFKEDNKSLPNKNKSDDLDLDTRSMSMSVPRRHTSPSKFNSQAYINIPPNNNINKTTTSTQPVAVTVTRSRTRISMKAATPQTSIRTIVPETPASTTTLLPYPQDMKPNSRSQLHFSDVWKKAEGKDVFPYVHRSVVSEYLNI